MKSRRRAVLSFCVFIAALRAASSARVREAAVFFKALLPVRPSLGLGVVFR